MVFLFLILLVVLVVCQHFYFKAKCEMLEEELDYYENFIVEFIEYFDSLDEIGREDLARFLEEDEFKGNIFQILEENGRNAFTKP